MILEEKNDLLLLRNYVLNLFLSPHLQTARPARPPGLPAPGRVPRRRLGRGRDALRARGGADLRPGGRRPEVQRAHRQAPRALPRQRHRARAQGQVRHQVSSLSSRNHCMYVTNKVAKISEIRVFSGLIVLFRSCISSLRPLFFPIEFSVFLLLPSFTGASPALS